MDENLGFSVGAILVGTSVIAINSGNNGLIKLALHVGDQELAVELDHEQYSLLIATLQLAEVVKRKLINKGYYASDERNEE